MAEIWIASNAKSETVAIRKLHNKSSFNFLEKKRFLQGCEVLAHIRTTLSSFIAEGSGEIVRVIYGGSVTPRNIDEIAALDGIDGVLAGTAAINAANFAGVVRAFAGRGG